MKSLVFQKLYKKPLNARLKSLFILKISFGNNNVNPCLLAFRSANLNIRTMIL